MEFNYSSCKYFYRQVFNQPHRDMSRIDLNKSKITGLEQQNSQKAKMAISWLLIDPTAWKQAFWLNSQKYRAPEILKYFSICSTTISGKMKVGANSEIKIRVYSHTIETISFSLRLNSDREISSQFNLRCQVKDGSFAGSTLTWRKGGKGKSHQQYIRFHVGATYKSCKDPSICVL